jgi:hypothetical protein
MWDSTTKVPDAGGSLAMSTESGSIVDSATTIVVPSRLRAVNLTSMGFFGKGSNTVSW